MHAKITEIFEKHQAWLDTGGDRAIKAVREANLIEAINQALMEAENEARTEGYLEGRASGWKQSAEANGSTAYPTVESWDTKKRTELQQYLSDPQSIQPSPPQPPRFIDRIGQDSLSTTVRKDDGETKLPI
jgi:hypothetical protein